MHSCCMQQAAVPSSHGDHIDSYSISACIELRNRAILKCGIHDTHWSSDECNFHRLVAFPVASQVINVWYSFI